MKTRNRKNQIKFRVDDNELAIINRRIKDSGFEHNRSAYFRKVAIDLQILKMDLSPFKKLGYEFDKIGNNINQIAHKVNTENEVQNNDIKALLNEFENLKNSYLDTYNKFIKIDDPEYNKFGDK